MRDMEKIPPGKALPAHAPRCATPRWLVPAALLVLLAAAVALAIALPVALKRRAQSNRAYQPLADARADGSVPDQMLAGAERTYYVAADPVEWDYAPSGRNLCKGKDFDKEEQLYVQAGAGRKFQKAVFREYTDNTFKERKQRQAEQEHMGLLGPVLHAEVGDTVVLVLRNNAAFSVNAEPGGLQAGNPTPVAPGRTMTYRWRVPESAGPGADGPSSRFFLYRSTFNVVADTQAGLAGPIVIARRGALGKDGRSVADVDREVFLMLQVFNENKSPYYDENMAAAPLEALQALSEDDLLEANTKYSINGFLWCNTPGMNFRIGERVRWYVTSLGSEDAIHTAHWHGVVFNDSKGHHVDQVPIQSSSLEALDMLADNPGTWLFHCHLNDHMDGGMMALFTIEGTAPPVTLDGKVRPYFVGVVTEEWDYAPFGGEMCGGTLVPFSDAAKVFLQPGADRIGRKYLKARFVEFTDDAFTRRKRIAPEWEHVGVMGPVLRAVVGDTLKVTFKNMLPAGSAAVSLHPHGVLYDKSSEGSPYADGLPPAPGDHVVPGESVVYTWRVPDRAGPGAGDFSSVMWMYHSHVMESRDPHAGLFGAILVTSKALANDDASPKDVDREFILSFSILDESHSFMLQQNLEKYLPKVAADSKAMAQLVSDPAFVESSSKHTINGYLYCNLPGFEFEQAVPTRVYFLSLGGSKDIHTPLTAEGGIYLDGQRRQAVKLLPGAMLTTDISPMVPGHGLLQCAVYDHLSAGMSAIFTVKQQVKIAPRSNAPIRSYYIAAEPVDWDYAPLGLDGCTGRPWADNQKVFVETNEGTLGSKYRKAVFRGYTDATFKTPAPREELFGILGPTIRAEPGDKIMVHFLNRLPFSASLQPFGGLIPLGNTSAYQQLNTGDGQALTLATAQRAGQKAIPFFKPTANSSAVAQPAAGRRLLGAPAAAAATVADIEAQPRSVSKKATPAQAEAEAATPQAVENLYSLGAVAPGASVRYEWYVPDAAAPGPGDGDAVAYAYVSGVDQIKHTNAGLVGAVVVYKKGGLGKDGGNATHGGGGVRELPLLFNIQDEMLSKFFEFNLARQQSGSKVPLDKKATTFQESNMMHSINGFVYCNGPTLKMRSGETLRVIVMGFGNEVDMHSAVFQGQIVHKDRASLYSVGVMPATTHVVDLTAGDPGTWDVYCNILDHIEAGMKIRAVVR